MRNGYNTKITSENVRPKRRNVDIWNLRVDTSDGKKHEFHNIPLSQIIGVEISKGLKISYIYPEDI